MRNRRRADSVVTMSVTSTLRTLALAGALVAGVAACGEDLPSVDCATPAVPTYAMVNAFAVSCNTCHASTLSGAARFGAPPGINYDTYEAAKAHAESGVKEVFGGSMPPTGALPAGDKEVFYRWGLCGTPQ